MTATDGLTLHEGIVLLALRDDKGTPHWGVWCLPAVAGALLTELIAREALSVASDSGKVRAVATSVSGDRALRYVLERVRQSKKTRSLEWWVSRLGADRQLWKDVVAHLCERGILREQTSTVLFFFKRKTYPQQDGEPERALRERIADVLFHSAEPTSREATLIALAYRSGLLSHNFDNKRVKQVKRRIEQLAQSDQAAEAAYKAITAMQAAVIVTVT